MSNTTPDKAPLANVVKRFLTAGRQVEAAGEQVVFTGAHAPLTEAQRHFLDCSEALVRVLAEQYKEGVANGEIPSGPCWGCGADATDRCDYPAGRDNEPRCDHWVCDDHLVIEAQHWDKRGWDGVDLRCQEHRNLSLDVRDVCRGRGLPPAPRWEGTGLLTAY